MDDDELPIPRFTTKARTRLGSTTEDGDIWRKVLGTHSPARSLSRTYLAPEHQDAAIMLAFTELKGVRPDRKRLALFLKYAG